jgi:iron complex outermembrane receptor protein
VKVRQDQFRTTNRIRAQINAFNLFDRDSTNCQAGFCYRGAPATVIGSLIYRW